MRLRRSPRRRRPGREVGALLGGQLLVGVLEGAGKVGRPGERAPVVGYFVVAEGIVSNAEHLCRPEAPNEHPHVAHGANVFVDLVDARSGEEQVFLFDSAHSDDPAHGFIHAGHGAAIGHASLGLVEQKGATDRPRGIGVGQLLGGECRFLGGDALVGAVTRGGEAEGEGGFPGPPLKVSVGH